MEQQKSRAIVPPRLNRKTLIFGLTFLELALTFGPIEAMFAVGGIHIPPVIYAVPAVYGLLSYRPRNGASRNALYYIRRLYHYYCSAQSYTQTGR